MPSGITELLKAAGRISTMWSLAAFAIAVILIFMQRQRHTNSPLVWGSLVAITLLGITPIAGSLYVQTYDDTRGSLYRVRVVVLDIAQTPIEQAQVWSSIGGEPKRVAGGWEFDIASSVTPVDGRVIFYAALPNAFLKGSAELQLSHDFNPTTHIQLRKDNTAGVRGTVVDGNGRTVTGATVSVIGYGSEAVQTDSNGGFVLAGHVAAGQQVQLHIEKTGYVAITQWVPAGDSSTQLVIERK